MNRSLVGLAFLIAALVPNSVVLAQEEPANVSSISLRESRTLILETSVRATTGKYSILTPGAPSNEIGWKGAGLGVRALTSSDASRTFFVGFDLRQSYAWQDGSGASFVKPDTTHTQLGVRFDLRPHWPLTPSIALSWMFGDLWHLKTEQVRFSGNSVAFSIGVPVARVHVALEGSYGKLNESGGFVYTGAPGSRQLEAKSLSLEVTWPLELPAPDWLRTEDHR